MSATPITVNVRQGRRAALPVSNATLLIGPASAGTDNAIVAIGSTSALVDEFCAASTAPGPLVQLAAMYLSIAKAPIYCMRINDSVAATIGSVTVTRVGTSSGTMADNSSAPVDAFSVIIEILTSGIRTAMTYRYSLDGGDNYTGPRTGAATITLGTSGVSLTLTDGGGGTKFEAGDVFSFTSSGPGWASADMQAALDAWISSGIRVRRIHAVGQSSTTIHSAIITRMGTAANSYKYARIIEETDDQGSGESVATWQASVLSDYAITSNRTILMAGWAEMSMVLNQDDLALQLRRPIAWLVGPRMAAIDVSQDPGAVIDGPLVGAIVSEDYPIPQDGRIYTAFDENGITYVQSYIGRAGMYCAGGFTRSDAGTDYYRVAHAQIIDVACETLYDIMLDYINTSVAANPDGTILEAEAKGIEARLNAAIEAVLVNVQPQRVSPADDGSYCVVDRTNDIVDDETLYVTTTLTPRGFIGSIVLTIGYSG